MKKKTLKYFYDCEFLEGPQKKRFLGIPVGETLNTIDLISIGVVSEDGREFYAVSKDFNLKEAWNRYQIEEGYNSGDIRNQIGDKWQKKVYWIRENVLLPIYYELTLQFYAEFSSKVGTKDEFKMRKNGFNYKTMKFLINRYGHTRHELKFRLTSFLLDPNEELWDDWIDFSDEYYKTICKGQEGVDVEMVGYYSAYDHVCLSWIYGKMIDLPDAMPMYTADIKPAINKYLEKHPNEEITGSEGHHALRDAEWTRDLYKLLKNADCV
jgi:hypothetical protein